MFEEIPAALPVKTVVVPGSRSTESVLPKLEDSLKTVLLHRKQTASDIDEMLADHPLSQALTSIPAIGVRTGARILREVGDNTAFPSAGHLASYAGIAPNTHRSGRCQKHNAALTCLARRRRDVLYAMLKPSSPTEHPHRFRRDAGMDNPIRSCWQT